MDALEVDIAPHQLNQLLHQRQPDSRSLDVRKLGPQPIERLKQFALFGFLDTDARVGDSNLGEAVISGGKGQTNGPAGPVVFGGIVDQVQQHLLRFQPVSKQIWHARGDFVDQRHPEFGKNTFGKMQAFVNQII